MNRSSTYIAFQGQQRIAIGDLTTVVQSASDVMERMPHASILVFDCATSQQIEINFRGTTAEIVERLAARLNGGATRTEESPDGPAIAPPKAGRPKLGVVAREVTLLPRHWEWLAAQPASASVTLRKLVEEAARNTVVQDRERVAREATHRFMMIIAGNLPGFEEASRALFRQDRAKFDQNIADWPVDIRDHVLRLAANAGWE